VLRSTDDIDADEVFLHPHDQHHEHDKHDQYDQYQTRTETKDE
jgi:hypothetical protein